MMALFGTEEWCERGEVFSVYFGMFSRLGSFGAKDGRLGRAPPVLGGDPAGRRCPARPPSSSPRSRPPASTAARRGSSRAAIESVYEWLVDGGLEKTAALRLTDTIFMVLCFAGVALVYLIGVRGMASGQGRAAAAETARRGFAHTLIPIAFAYLVAHYFSLFVFQEQAQFTYLLSDPLGTATTDLFGTASGGIDFKVISANAIWYVQVGALVIGHVDRPGPGPRPRHRLVGRLPRGRPLPVLDAGGDGRLHLLRPLPALGGQRLRPIAARLASAPR